MHERNHLKVMGRILLKDNPPDPYLGLSFPRRKLQITNGALTRREQFVGGRVLEWGTILEIEGLGSFLEIGLTVMQNQSG
jgi:hypothetical protein